LLNVFSRREIDCTVKQHLLSVKPAMAILKSGSRAIGCAQVLAVSAVTVMVTVIESLLKTLAIARTARAIKLTAGRSSDEFALELHYARAAGAKVSRYRCCASVMLRASIQSGKEKQCLPRERPFAATVNGAHCQGCASYRSPLPIRSFMEMRNASARPTFGFAFNSAKARVVSLTAVTYQRAYFPMQCSRDGIEEGTRHT
jgi:hypothetical protein